MRTWQIVAPLLLVGLSACKTTPTLPVRVETHAVQAGKMAPGDSEAAFRLVNSVRDPESVVLIYDASGSMRWPIREGGEERFGPAYQGLLQFIDRLSRNDHSAIIVYGSQLPSGVSDGRVTNPARAKASCQNDIKVVMPMASVGNRQAIKEKVSYLSRIDSYRGDTPIGGALMKAAELLAGAQGAKRVILLTDGVEECYPAVPGSINPEDAVKRLGEAGVVVDIVFSGGGLNAQGATTSRSKDTAASLRALATGQFFEAGSFDDLVDALLRIEIAKFRYQLVDRDGKIAAQARIGDSISVPPGEYEFRGMTAKGFTKKLKLPEAPSARIYLALSRDNDDTPDLLVVPEKP